MINSILLSSFALLVFTVNVPYAEGKQSFRLSFNLGLASNSYFRLESTIAVPLREFTLCSWVRLQNFTSRTLFSYSTPKRFDEIWTGIDVKENGKSSVFLHRQTNENETLEETGVSSEAQVSIGDWVDVCITWSKFKGSWKMYVDGKNVGKGHELGKNHHIAAGGIAVFGQDQDAYGGVFQSEDAFRGDISEFHLWDYLLLPEQISQFHTCTLNNEGNVISWSKAIFRMQNAVEIAPVWLPCGSPA